MLAPTKVILVTGYLPLNVKHRSQEEYTAFGAQLFAVGLPTVAFLDPAVNVAAGSNVTRIDASLTDCWYRRLLVPGVRNPVGDDDKKDTFDHYTVEHQKTTWARMALEATAADAALWVDFGMFYLGDFEAPLREMVARIESVRPDKILMPTIRPLPKDRFDYSKPQWFCAGGVFLVPRQHAIWFDAATQLVANDIVSETQAATWEVNTWARVMQMFPEKFTPYSANHDVMLFTGYQPLQSAPAMKIAVYSLAKNEEKHAAAWAESCKEADYRVVTDTGSTDKTPDILRAAGVTVHTGNVVPWRWDEAHNLSLHHVPSDVDVCVRLDLDERFKPGWREAIEKAWKPETTKLRYMYTWSMTPDGKPLKRFPSDRVHSRSGYRWTGATHEGLIRWNGPETYAWSDELEILHHRDTGKKHSTDLELLKIAVRETPHDARMHWYLARQLDYEKHADARAAFEKYLELPGGSSVERSYACRVLARLVSDKKLHWLQRSTQECPGEPDGYYELARHYHEAKDALSALYWAAKAVSCSPTAKAHTSDLAAYGHLPADIAGVSAFLLGLHKEALRYTKIALERNPNDSRLKRNLEQLEAQMPSH